MDGMRFANDFVEGKVLEVIDGLVAGGPPQERLATATERLSFLEFYKREIPAPIWDELACIVGCLKDSLETKKGERRGFSCNLTSDEEENLAGRLLDLYVEINGGVLIF